MLHVDTCIMCIYDLLSNPIVYVQYNIIKLKLLVSFTKRITTIRVVSSSDAVYRTDKTYVITIIIFPK
jgi:UDP-glucose 4-epimerase